jgi:hypothetical protein
MKDLVVIVGLLMYGILSAVLFLIPIYSGFFKKAVEDIKTEASVNYCKDDTKQ